jgi:hypothetical protein
MIVVNRRTIVVCTDMGPGGKSDTSEVVTYEVVTEGGSFITLTPGDLHKLADIYADEEVWDKRNKGLWPTT